MSEKWLSKIHNSKANEDYTIIPDQTNASGKYLKSNGTNPEWAEIDTVPAGGTTGQVLTKNSNTDGDATWQDPAAADPDGITIDNNDDNKLQAIGVIEKNAGAVKYDWVGTIEDYNDQNIKNLHPEWTCYITNDNESLVQLKSARLPLFYKIVTKRKLNDASWLAANPFSWQYSSIYIAAYEHLVKDTENKIVGGIWVAGQSKTVSIEGISITYYEAEDGDRICLPDQETNLSQLYEKTGSADFFVLDTTNERFKLPRTQKRELLRTVDKGNGTWYNLYSDGWVRQAGTSTGGQYNNPAVITLPVSMRDTNYAAIVSISSAQHYTDTATWVNKTLTTIGVATGFNGSNVPTTSPYTWEVEGYAATSAISNEPIQYEYYYVGNFQQNETEQTLGNLLETLNTGLATKVDKGNEIVDFQEPTSANGWTWYKKYANGWVEQGTYAGAIAANSVFTFNFPIPYKNIHTYYILALGTSPELSWQGSADRTATYCKIKNSYASNNYTDIYTCGQAAD